MGSTELHTSIDLKAKVPGFAAALMGTDSPALHLSGQLLAVLSTGEGRLGFLLGTAAARRAAARRNLLGAAAQRR